MKIFKNLLLITILFIGVTSCKKTIEKESPSPKANSVSSTTFTEEEIGHGVVQVPEPVSPILIAASRLNPYTVATMSTAFTNLVNEGTLQPGDFDIRPTHKYVRFLPATEDDYNILIDEELELYGVPFEAVIDEQAGGDYYVDDNLPAGQTYTWQYTYVPASYTPPSGLQYEVIDDLYLPDQDPYNLLNGELDPAKEDIVYTLDEEALRITGNLEPGEEKPGRSKARPSKWNPSGTIRLWDTRFNQLQNLEGLKIRVRRWYTIKTAYTDANGYFWISHQFRRPVNYSAVFERHDFDIRNGEFGQAYIDGPKVKGQWNNDIWGGHHYYWATIFLGLRDYYYGHAQFGLNAPPPKTWSRPKLKVAAMNRTKQNTAGSIVVALRTFGIFGIVRIYLPGNNSDRIYATTVHEVGHYSHWAQNPYFYRQCEDRVAESWGEGIEWVFTSSRYGAWGDDLQTGPDFVDAFQHRTMAQFPVYTSIVVDLMDNHNQRVVLSTPAVPDDRVDGYTIEQIEDAMNSSVLTFNDWRDRLRDNYNNPTENNLNALFGSW